MMTNRAVDDEIVWRTNLQGAVQSRAVALMCYCYIILYVFPKIVDSDVVETLCEMMTQWRPYSHILRMDTAIKSLLLAYCTVLYSVLYYIYSTLYFY